DRDVAGVRVPMIALARAEPEHLLVVFLGPVRTTVAMRRGERHATSEIAGHSLVVFAEFVASRETLGSWALRRNPRRTVLDHVLHVGRPIELGVEIFLEMLRFRA